MVPLQLLWQEARRRGVYIRWFALPKGRGLYYQDTDLAKIRRSIIFLHPQLHKDEIALRTVLAHELGHDHAASGTSLLASDDQAAAIERRNERLANVWAADYCIGEARFLEFVREHPNLYEVAEEFGVEPWLAAFAAEEYKRRWEARRTAVGRSDLFPRNSTQFDTGGSR